MTAPTDALVERYGRWLQNIGYDGGADSPPMRMLAAYKSSLARIEAAEKVIEPFANVAKAITAGATDDLIVWLEVPEGRWTFHISPDHFRAAAQWQAGQEGEG